MHPRSSSFKVKHEPIMLWLFNKTNWASAFEICNTEFRTHMVNLLGGFKEQRKNGVFLNSCFSHCQTESHDTWYSKNSPSVKNKVGNTIGFYYRSWFVNYNIIRQNNQLKRWENIQTNTFSSHSFWTFVLI